MLRIFHTRDRLGLPEDDTARCHHGQLNVHIDSHGGGGTQCVHVKEVNGIANDIFNDHAPGIPINEFRGRALHLIGNQNRGLIMAQIFDEKLSERFGIVSQLNGFIHHTRAPIGAPDIGEPDFSPCRWIQSMDSLDQCRIPAPQCNKIDPQPIQFGQVMGEVRPGSSPPGVRAIPGESGTDSRIHPRQELAGLAAPPG